jgi:hypothetical protein
VQTTQCASKSEPIFNILAAISDNSPYGNGVTPLFHAGFTACEKTGTKVIERQCQPDTRLKSKKGIHMDALFAFNLHNFSKKSIQL